MSTIFMGTGLATKLCAAPLTGDPLSAIPPISGSYFASQSNVQSALDGRTDPTRIEEDEGDCSLQQTFIEIFEQPPEVSLFDKHLPENEINEALSLLKDEDLSPIFQNAPPPFNRSKVFWKDAIDRAGERTETYLYLVKIVTNFSMLNNQVRRYNKRNDSRFMFALIPSSERSSTR